MQLKIKQIILYPKNKDLKARVLAFKEDKVNVITGYSQRGKSALISIIDYCLGSSDCHVPIGKIRNNVDVFAINCRIGDRFIFIARENPSGRSRTNMYYELYDKEDTLSFSFERWIENSASFISNRDDVKNLLGRLAGFENISEKDEFNNSGFDAPASFRDTSAFQFQPQNIIANPTTIFYNTDSFEHLKRLKILFPLVLGYKSYEILRLEKEIEVLEKEEKELSKKIEEIRVQYENWQADIFRYYSVAVSFGLSAKKLDHNSASVDTIKTELKQIINNSKSGDFFKLGSSFTYAGNLETLDIERLRLLRELDEGKNNLAKIEQFDRLKETYFQKVVDEIDNRLSPLDWWIDANGTNTCPFCNSESTDAIDRLLELKNVQLSNKEIIAGSSSKDFSFEEEKISTKAKIKSLENELKNVEINIELLLNENRQFYKQYQEVFEFVGRIEHVIENLEKISPSGELSEKLQIIVGKLALKRTELKHLKKKFDKESCLSKVTSCIDNYVKILPIEEREKRIVKLDPDNSVSIKIEDTELGNLTFLSKIGSGANHMGYHIATLLGLHEYFVKLSDSGKKNYIPSFLVLDQPSQVYFPEGYEKAARHNSSEEEIESLSEDIKNTTAIFNACSVFMTRTNLETQLIILEHAPSSTWENIDHIHLVEEWRGNKEIPESNFNALIQQDWL